MASAVDISNLALSHIGQRAAVLSISPPEPTIEAQACARFYPIARNEMIELHAWGFATTRIALAELTSGPPAGWLYAYQVPNGCMKILSLLYEDQPNDMPTAKYIREGDALYTNVVNATLRFTQEITDTTKFSPLFIVALSHLLASYLAGYIIKGKEGVALADAQLKKAYAKLGLAESSDGNSERTQTYQDTPAASIAARA